MSQVQTLPFTIFAVCQFPYDILAGIVSASALVALDRSVSAVLLDDLRLC